MHCGLVGRKHLWSNNGFGLRHHPRLLFDPPPSSLPHWLFGGHPGEKMVFDKDARTTSDRQTRHRYIVKRLIINELALL